jgi:hypothetical protein
MYGLILPCFLPVRQIKVYMILLQEENRLTNQRQ